MPAFDDNGLRMKIGQQAFTPSSALHDYFNNFAFIRNHATGGFLCFTAV
jgi:hypothetical protein